MVSTKINSATAIAVFDACADRAVQANKLSFVVLDNAPIHTNRDFHTRVMEWFFQGGRYLTLAAPCSPELNLIEIL